MEKLTFNQFEKSKLKENSLFLKGGGTPTAIITGCPDGTTEGDGTECDCICL